MCALNATQKVPVALVRRALRAACGAFAGLGLWCSFGTLAPVGDGGLPSFVGLLPPVWLLALLSVSGALAAWLLIDGPPFLILLPTLPVLAWSGVAIPGVRIWAGPSALLLWLLLALAVSSTWWVHPRWLSPPRMPKVAFAAAAALVTVGVLGWQIRPTHISGDEPHYLLIAGSLLTDGDLELTNDYDLERQRPYYGGSLEPRHTLLTETGEQYSFHGIGTSVLVAPGFALAGVTGARLGVLLISLFGAVVFWKAAHESTGGAGPAAIAVSALVLPLPWLVQSTSLYPDGLAAAVTSVALWTVLRVERKEPASLAALVATGAALATLPWLHVRLSAIAAAFGLAFLWLTWRKQLRFHHFVWMMAVPVISAELWLASFALAFGTWNPMTPFHQAAAGSLASAPIGLLGLLIDHEYGLLVYAPAMVFAVPGLVLLARGAPVTMAAGVGAALVTLLTAASYVWWGGTSGPARFLVPVLPIGALGIGLFWARASTVGRAAVATALALGAGVSLLGMADAGAYVIGNPDARFTVFERANANVDLAAALPSLFRAGTSPSKELQIALVWIGCATAATILLRGAVRRWPSQVVPLAASAVVLWITIAASMSWRVRGIDGLTSERAQLAMLRAATRTWLSTTMVGTWPAARAEALARLRIRSAPDDRTTLLELAEVPAGRYELLIAAPPGETGHVALEAGSGGGALWSWPVRNGESPAFSLALPVRSLRVALASGHERAAGWSAALRPLEVGDAPRSLEAQHVARFGDLFVYALDGLVDAEPDRLWVWGGRRTSLVFAWADERVAPTQLRLQATDEDIEIRLVMPGKETRVALARGTSHDLTVNAGPSLEPWLIDVSGPRRPRAVLVTTDATSHAQ